MSIIGWSSGTELFDGCVRVALEHAPHHNGDDGAFVPPKIRRTIVESVYRVFDGSDWDTEDESDYFHTDLVHIMHDLGRIDDEDYRWYTEDSDNN